MEIRMNEKELHAGENAARTLTLSVDAAYRDHGIRLALLSPAGRRFLTPEIALTNGEAQYPLPACVLDAGGRLLAQIVAENDDLQVVKSEVFGFDVDRSIPADGAQTGSAGLITLGSLQGALNAVEETLALCARTSDLPTVPDNVSAFENDADYATKAFVEETVDIAQRESLPAHTHDDRYYTEAETDALLALKADAGVVQGLFTPDPAMEYASWLESEVRQVGSMVHMYLEVNKGSAFGSNEVTLGTFSGVAMPQRATIVTVCLTDKLNGGFHYGMAKIKNNGTVKLICSEATDDCAYINVSYQTATN